MQANEAIDGVKAQPVFKKAKVKRKQADKTVNRQKDIRHFFKKQEVITNAETRSKIPLVITIRE